MITFSKALTLTSSLSIDRNGRPELIMRESGIDAYLNLVK